MRRAAGHLSCLLCLSIVLLSASRAADIEHGEALHNAHCLRCHQSDIYETADRLVHTLPQLRERVKQCELMNELLWFDEEVIDVSDYLNAYYYLFGIK